GGVIVFVDEDDNPYSVVVNRLSRMIVLREVDYQELLAQYAAEAGYVDSNEDESLSSFSDLVSSLEADDVNDVNDSNDIGEDSDYDPLASIKIPGPYGPPWPFVTEPIEFELGSATVRIEIEDENAKYPLGWALLADAQIKREAQVGFEIFCEWMGMDRGDIDSLEEQLKEIGAIKPFKLDFKTISRTVRTTSSAPSRTSSSGTTRSRRTPLTRISRKTISPAAQIAEQTAFFCKAFSQLDDRHRDPCQAKCGQPEQRRYKLLNLCPKR
ncbi:unnamed protein product, partial [marine sediment metagenome]